MRINLHPDRSGIWPGWFADMINDYIEEFRKEYAVKDTDVYRYFFSNNLERVQKLFEDKGIKVETNKIEDLPSQGIIIPDDNPNVVMYKLKHQGNSNAES